MGPRPPLGSAIVTLPSSLVSLRRMQNNTAPAAPNYVGVTAAGKVYVNTADSGLSGFGSTSMVPYRPSQSVEAWMYLGSAGKMGKVSAGAISRNLGIAEAQVPCTADVSESSQSAVLSDFESQTPWNLIGTASLSGPTNRYNATITKVLMDEDVGQGVPGDSSCVLSGTTNFAKNTVGYVNASLGAPCFVEDSFAAPPNSTIASIIYDSGSHGLCWIELTGSPLTVTRNQVYRINSGGGTDEYVRVLQVFGTGAGQQTWIRVDTIQTHFAAETLTGAASWRIYFATGAHDGDTIRNRYLSMGVTATGDGMFTTNDSGGTIQGRQIQPTDTVHLLVNASSVAFTNLIITFDIDPNDPSFETNALQWTIPSGSFSAGNWVDISIAISALTRIGTNTDLDFNSGITGIQFRCTTGAAVTFEFSDLLIVGQYGPSVPTGESGLFYCGKFRDPETGAVSNPCPPMRVAVFPASTGQGVVIIPPVTLESQTIGAVVDIYRFGNGLQNYTYVGTGEPGVPFLDVLDDLTVAGNPLMAFDDFQPFPSIDLPHNGTVDVQGFTVTRASGDFFDTSWGPGTEITIGQNVYTLYRRPIDQTHLEILQDGGTQNGATYSIPRPVVLAQPLPAIWGPTDNAGFLFGCGDPLRPGTLYFTKGNNPDSAPDTNQVEVTSPSEPLMNGVLLAGLGMVFSTERAWWIYPNFANVVSTVTGVQGNPFYMIEAITNRGLYARHAICTDGGGVVYFLAKDGIYKSSGGKAECVTDLIYSMFPHETSTQQGITINGVTVNPPNMDPTSGLDSLSLAFSEDRVYFDYKDVSGNWWSLVLDVRTGLWGVDTTTPTVTVHAQQEGNSEGTAVGCSDGTIRAFTSGGSENFSAAIQSVMEESAAPGWQHAQEFNFNYTAPSNVTVTITAAAGGISPSAVVMPSASTQTKALSPVTPNKFKLAQYQISGSGAWRVWTQGFEIKQGDWERSDAYKPVNPFAAFGSVQREAAA